MRKRMAAAVAMVLVGIGSAGIGSVGIVVLDPFAGSSSTVTCRTSKAATTDAVQQAETRGTIVAAHTYQLAFGSDPTVVSATASTASSTTASNGGTSTTWPATAVPSRSATP